MSANTRDKKKAEIKEWLSNFLPSEIDDAVLILSKIQHKDDKMIHDAIAYLAKEIIAIFKNDFSGVKFFPLGESPSSSGGMYLYDFRKELSLSEDNFPYSQFKDNLAGTQALVFFDDMIGSGNQAIRFANKNIKDLGVESYYISIFAFKDGLEKVREQACFKMVFCGHLLTDEERAFHDKTVAFTDPKARTRLRSLCEEYGKQLYPEHPLGYDDSQALLVFPHNTPNNTLPIIWASPENEKADGTPWHPVFERKKRIVHLKNKEGIQRTAKHGKDSTEEIFQTKGGLPICATSYVKRKCDDDLSTALKEQQFIGILGEYGMGKSSLCNQIPGLLSANQKLCLMDLQGYRTDSIQRFPEEFFRSVGESVGEVRSWQDLVTHLQKCPTVICLDEFGALTEITAPYLVPHLYACAHSAPDNLRIVVCLPKPIGSFLKEVGVDNTKYIQCWHPINVKPFSESEAVDLVNLLPEHAARIVREQIKIVMKLSEGHPQALQNVCAQIIEELHKANIHLDLVALISDGNNYR